MLDACAPGWKREETTHYYRIMWNAKTYPSFPKGEHGKKQGQAEVQIGHIKQMVRQLGIETDCAKKYLNVLR